MRRQLRHRAVGPRHRHHRRGRALHHRHGLGEGLGQADRAGARARRSRSASSAPAPPAWRPPTSCAAAGYQVTVYDRHDRAGGLLIYGIPNFKLEKDVVERRTQRLADGGVDFRLNFEVGTRRHARRAARDARRGPDRHRRLQGARPAGARRAARQAWSPALDYLIASNRKGLGDAVPDFDSGTLNAAGKNVVVIGGGDTAMDCVRTAVRQGATSVTCLYRRDRANMPGSQREVANAEEEGVEFDWLAAPARRARATPTASPACAPPACASARPTLGPPGAGGDRGRRLRAAGRPGDQGAGLRSRGPARRCSASRT